MGTLLMLAPPMLPFVCVVKLAAALVLLPVSAASVVVGVKGVAEKAATEDKKSVVSTQRHLNCFNGKNPGKPSSPQTTETAINER
jgi:hypothetical protein